MDGVLVVDKPHGLTSHDVVVAVRRLLDERRIGHTGTLDPLATGVLPLACGRATRLVRFLAATEKDYDATIRFGVSTNTYDITGQETARSARVPSRDELVAALASCRGEQLQTPPAFSAKKVGGQRAYARARTQEPIPLAPVPVRLFRVELLEQSGDEARLSLTCSAGFYVRALAHQLGEQVGTGACLAALRRTRSGTFGLEHAVPLEHLSRAGTPTIRLEQLLPELPVVTVTAEGRQRVSHGRTLDGEHWSSEACGAVAERVWVRLVDERGHLVALARQGGPPGSLHPAVVLI